MTHSSIAQAVARFPGSAAALRRLALADQRFREVCEEYALALASLARFEALQDASERPEVGDYRAVIAELEVEIWRYLEEAGPRG